MNGVTLSHTNRIPGNSSARNPVIRSTAISILRCFIVRFSFFICTGSSRSFLSILSSIPFYHEYKYNESTYESLCIIDRRIFYLGSSLPIQEQVFLHQPVTQFFESITLYCRHFCHCHHDFCCTDRLLPFPMRPTFAGSYTVPA